IVDEDDDEVEVIFNENEFEKRAMGLANAKKKNENKEVAPTNIEEENDIIDEFRWGIEVLDAKDECDIIERLLRGIE
ncbi:UNVERIFIED_CONTAM: hypothetical protein ITH36_25785, partial [Salmonella enterica subsp. enterica serovar Weltevreden]